MASDSTTVALLSDIHSETDALAAVERALNRQGIERVWCLGDSVDWLLPREPLLRGDTTALRRVRELCEQVLIGNHEAELLAAPFGVDFLRAQPQGDELAAWLGSLGPLKELPGEIVLVHGSLTGPTWSFVETADDAQASFARSDARLIVCGHTHLPFLASCDASGAVEVHRLPAFGAEQLLSSERRWLVNPGSVGRAPLEGMASWAALRLDEDGRPIAVSWQVTGFERTLHLPG